MAAKVRLDRLLVERGHAGSLEQARGLIASGRVRVDGIPAQNTATQVDCARPVTVVSGEHEWVGRGARKLLSVIDGRLLVEWEQGPVRSPQAAESSVRR